MDQMDQIDQMDDRPFAANFIVHQVHPVHPVHQNASLVQTFAVKLIVEPTFDALIAAFFFSD